MISSAHFSKRLWPVLASVSISLTLLALIILIPQTTEAAPQAPTVYVVTRTDDGPQDFGCGATGMYCTLRNAIGLANANPGSTIKLTHNAVYVLTDTVAGELLATADMTITTDLQCIIFITCPAVIQGKSGWNNRILEIGSNAHVALNNLTIRYGNMAFGAGGGIYNGGSLTLTATTLYSNTAWYITGFDGYGGGLANYGTLKMQGGAFLNNGSDNGGGLYNGTGNVAVINYTSFTGNFSSNGGAIENQGILTVTSSTIANNQATYGWVGGVANIYDAQAAILNTTITNNSSNGYGGIYNGGTLTLVGDQIKGNSAQSNNGGGIFNDAGRYLASSLTMINTVVDGNSANSGAGGGLYNNKGATLQVSNSTFSNNQAKLGGGLYHTSTLPVSLLSTSFLTNSASDSGGGLYTDAHAGAITLFDGVFRANSAWNRGGGLYDAYLSQPILISNTTFSFNTTSNSTGFNGGGALYSNSDVSIYNSTFSANTTYRDGGAIKSNNAQIALNNTTLNGNLAHRDGGAIENSGGFLALANVTVANNTAWGMGGGISNTNTLRAKDSILGGNVANTAYDCAGTLTSQGYNLIEHVTGCNFSQQVGELVGVSPQLDVLKDNGGPTWTQALLSGSPAFDAGNPTGCLDTNLVPFITDQRGMPRTLGSRCDMGAVEMGALVFLPAIER